MNEAENKSNLSAFYRNSYIALFLYCISVTVAVYFALEPREDMIPFLVKMPVFLLYLLFMILSIVNLKNIYEAYRKDDYSIDMLIAVVLGIPLYFFAFIYSRIKVRRSINP